MGEARGGKGARHSKAGARAVSLAALIGLFLITSLFLLIIGAHRAAAYNPLIGTEPNPWLEGNVTIATHTSGWGTLEYSPSSGAPNNLTAVLDSRVKTGTVTVTPSAVIAPGVLQQNKFAGSVWNATTFWSGFSAFHGSVAGSVTQATVNGVQVIQDTLNGTGGGAQNSRLFFANVVAAANYPSATLGFDWVTFVLGLSGPACTGGASNCYLTFENAPNGGSNAYACAWNSGNGTVTGSSSSTTCASGSTLYKIFSGTVGIITCSLAQLSSTGASGFATNMQPDIWLTLPSGSTTAYTATVYGAAFTTTSLTLGTSPNATGNITRNVYTTTLSSGVAANANLTGLSPSFTYTQVVGGGYVAAIQERAQDLPSNGSSIQQAQVGTNGSEQLTYSFTFSLPNQPSLTYVGFKLVDIPRLAPWQYVAVNYAGTSYLATYQTTANLGKNVTIVSAVTPTSAASWVGTVIYTPTQWDSIAGAPPLFSTNGFQYWFFVFLSLIVTAIGGTSAWAARNLRGLKIRGRGVGGVLFMGPPRRRRVRTERGVAGRHIGAVIIGLTFLGASGAALWAVFAGADTTGITAVFIGALILILIVVAIAFASYEVAHWARRRRHHEG